MVDQSYTTTFAVDRTPSEVIDAIKDVRGWWSKELDGRSAGPGDEFRYQYEDVHRCDIRVTEVVPGRKVSWLVLDNYFNFTEGEDEWTGTTIDFEVVANDERTEVRFIHHGLLPEHECFAACSSGWTFYINTSLQQLITTGEGQPNDPEKPRTAA